MRLKLLGKALITQAKAAHLAAHQDALRLLDVNQATSAAGCAARCNPKSV